VKVCFNIEVEDDSDEQPLSDYYKIYTKRV